MNLQKYKSSHDERVGYIDIFNCPNCHTDSKKFYDHDRNYLYDSPCSCGLDDEKKKNAERLNKKINSEYVKEMNKQNSGLSAKDFEKKYKCLNNQNSDNWYKAFKWLEDFKNGKTNKGLLFTGTTGTGKTTLAKALMINLLDSGFPCMIITPTEYISNGKKRMSDSNIEDIQEVCKNIQVLVIDDLGAESKSIYNDAEMFNLINYRFEKELTTIFTTNLNKERLMNRYDSDKRTYSRLRGCVNNEYVLKFTGADMRIENSKQEND